MNRPDDCVREAAEEAFVRAVERLDFDAVKQALTVWFGTFAVGEPSRQHSSREDA